MLIAGCGERWESGVDGLRHTCHYHFAATGACVCPCGRIK